MTVRGQSGVGVPPLTWWRKIKDLVHTLGGEEERGKIVPVILRCLEYRNLYRDEAVYY